MCRQIQQLFTCERETGAEFAVKGERAMSDRVYGGSHFEWAEYLYALAARRDEDVPEAASSHVRECASCRERVARLREAVEGASGEAGERGGLSNRATIEALNSHFHLLDEKVVCARVRPFLPGLLDPSLNLRIPTPVTVHVDQCPQCAEDLKLLRGLGLNARQLKRLQWLYGQGPADGPSLCRRARCRIAAFVRGAWRDIDGEILNHLSRCPRCRTDVYARRQSLLDDPTASPDDRCDCVAPAELFDRVVPHADILDSVESVVASSVMCRRGLEMIQAMHRVIYGIAERAESGTAIVYRIAENDGPAGAKTDDAYAGYPIAVEIVQGSSQRTQRRVGPASKAAIAKPRIRRILKTVSVAAAAILLAVLFYSTHGSSGTTMARVVRAFGQVRNVRVVSLSPQGDQVAYELWVSRDLNLTGMLTPQQCVVYDLANREKEDVISGAVSPLDDFELTRVREMGDRCLGFSLAGVPADAQWERISLGGNREVHEFTWMRQTDLGRDVPTKYEVAIDTSTMLPVSLRLFRIEPLETEWECQSLILFEYPTKARMRSVMMGEPVASDDDSR